MGVRTADKMTGGSVLIKSLRTSGGFYYSAIGKTRLCGRENSESGEIFRPRKIIPNSVRGGFRCARLTFIRAGTIEARHVNANQPEVHRELGAMMNMVVHHHAANACNARHVENLLAAR